MKLTKSQKDKLWGEDGPYSQVQLIIETRILDDSISRIFVLVEVHINPLTFEIIKENRDQFKDDKMIQQIIDFSEFRGDEFGYVSCAFQKQHTLKVLKEANHHLEYAEMTIIKMHKFVMDLLETDYTNEA